MSAGRVEEFDRAVEGRDGARPGEPPADQPCADARVVGELYAHCVRGGYDEARQRADEALDISGAAPNFAMGRAA